MANNNMKPLTRKEAILAGEDITPLSRDEYFLKQHVASGGGSGGGVVYATFTPNQSTGVWSCDKTFAELKSAHNSGAIVLMQIPQTGINFMQYVEDDSSGNEVFGGNLIVPILSGSEITSLVIASAIIKSDGSVTVVMGVKDL